MTQRQQLEFTNALIKLVFLHLHQLLPVVVFADIHLTGLLEHALRAAIPSLINDYLEGPT